MSEKPTYLGLLNAIAVAETRAHCYLSAWAETTASDDVRAVLRTVAAREGEHGMSFAKRINELGFHVRTTDDPNFGKTMTLVKSKRSDLQKTKGTTLPKRDTGATAELF